MNTIMDEQNQGGIPPQNVPPQPNSYINNPNGPVGDIAPQPSMQQPPQAAPLPQQPAAASPQGPMPAGAYPPTQPQPQVPPQPDGGAQPAGLQPGQLPPDEKAAKKKKLIIFGALGGAILLLIIIVVVVLLLGGNKKATDDTPRLLKRYDSPAGIAAPFQSGDVKNGTFKLTTNYLTGNDVIREGTFFVEDGRIAFEMLPDDTKVNERIRDLYIKQGKQADYTEKFQGATKNFRYDFMSFLGYHYLNDVNLEKGFIPTVEAARDNPQVAAANKALRLGRDCNAALSELKGKIDGNMQITDGLEFDLSREGIRTKAVVAFSSRQSIDASIVRFLENCYDHKAPEAEFYKTFTESLKHNVTSSPTFITWEQGGKYIVEVRDMPESDTFGGTFTFELSGFNQATTAKTDETASYAERRNEYGLAYSHCRVEPAVTTTIEEGYRFLMEDTAYGYPVQEHSGYYCTTTEVPSEFAIAQKMTLKLDNALIKQVDKKKFPRLQAVHDLEHYVERYNQQNKRYPNNSEFTDLVNSSLSSLTVDAQAALTDKTLRYIAEPAQCVGDCTSYALTYQYAPNFRIARYTY